MNADIIAAVLHLREAARLLQNMHPELSLTLRNVADAFAGVDASEDEIAEMEAAADKILAKSDGCLN